MVQVSVSWGCQSVVSYAEGKWVVVGTRAVARSLGTDPFNWRACRPEVHCSTSLQSMRTKTHFDPEKETCHFWQMMDDFELAGHRPPEGSHAQCPREAPSVNEPLRIAARTHNVFIHIGKHTGRVPRHCDSSSKSLSRSRTVLNANVF